MIKDGTYEEEFVRICNTLGFDPSSSLNEKQQLSIIRNYGGLCIRLIENPTEKAKLEAVKNNRWAILDIKDPSVELMIECCKDFPIMIQECEQSKHYNRDVFYKLIRSVENKRSIMSLITFNRVLRITPRTVLVALQNCWEENLYKYFERHNQKVIRNKYFIHEFKKLKIKNGALQ